MADNPRIEELRRRVDADPASIAFAALAEEYRRSGAYQDAIETCRTGLQRHPSYVSARVTLGRALIEVGDYDAARVELESVLKTAPENLAAIRAMAEIHDRPGPAEASAAATAARPAPAEPAHPGITDWNLPPAPLTFPAALPLSTAAPPNAAVLERLESLLASIHAARSVDRAGR